MWWKCPQARPLDQEAVSRALAGGAVDPLIGDVVAPFACLSAQVFQGSEGAAIEEGMADVLDARLERPLYSG